jgi:hypothetical protein
MVRLPGWHPIVILLIGSFWGCTGLTPVPPPLSLPFFTPTTEDVKRLETLTRELDHRALRCLKGPACEQVHFARALVNLFENQEAARASFRRVIKDNPSSTLAASSRLWLQLIGEDGADAAGNERHDILITLMAQSLRDWMTRELTEDTNDGQGGEPTDTPNAEVAPSHIVLGLQKQVRERDRRISILESQLEALKVIDQDAVKRSKRSGFLRRYDKLDSH